MVVASRLWIGMLEYLSVGVVYYHRQYRHMTGIR